MVRLFSYKDLLHFSVTYLLSLMSAAKQKLAVAARSTLDCSLQLATTKNETLTLTHFHEDISVLLEVLKAFCRVFSRNDLVNFMTLCRSTFQLYYIRLFEFAYM